MPGEKITPWLRVSSFLGKGPRYLSAYAGWRARRALRALGGAAGWPRAEELRGALPPGDRFSGDLAPSLIRAGHASRRSPAPLCDWSQRERIARLVPEAARSRTVARADAAASRRFRYRGLEVQFNGKVDWARRPGGNLDWTWDLNRHGFFVALGRAYWYTGDERYARAFADLLLDWMAANPPGVRSPAWRSVFEAGARVASWCWAHALFLNAPSLTDAEHLEVLRGILGLGRFLHANIERHAWNNHLLLEAKALAMAGLLYPELPGARDWARDGIRLLERELERQVLLDGVHSERSSLYHAIIASELLEHLVVLRLAGHTERDPHYCTALVKLVGMAMFQGAITRADGTLPLLGDASRGDEQLRFDAPLGARVLLDAPGVPARPRADEDLIWLLAAVGKEQGLEDGAAGEGTAGKPERPRPSRAFRAGGYFVLESRLGEEPLHLVFDCGPFGDPVVPGHGHADALSVDLAVGRSHLLVDPGMYSAHLGERWRNYFRGTAAHNTVLVDGLDQSILSGLRRVYRPAHARLTDWASCDAFDLAAGAHLGYARCEGRVVHQREILFWKPRWWLVLDRLEGRGSHRYDLLWHFHPRSEVVLDPATLAATARTPGGCGLALVPIDPRGLEAERIVGAGEGAAEGEPDEPVQGWTAFESGAKEPSPVVRYRREGASSAAFATLLVPLVPGARGAPRVERVEAARAGRPAEDAVAGVLRFPDGAAEAFVASPVRAVRGAAERRASLAAGDLETDALVACAGTGPGGRIASGLVYRGWELRWRGEPVARFEADPVPGHFAFRLEGGLLEVSSPAGSLVEGLPIRFSGEAARASRVLWNGAEPAARREGDSLLVAWQGPARKEGPARREGPARKEGPR
ncbi:MAG: alginate lyase family protein [Planctomycetes bacterium]|nr:alginate lyase family protein [Planctomycetota bacterium]